MYAATYTYTTNTSIKTETTPHSPVPINIIFEGFPLAPLLINLTLEEATQLLAELEVAIHAIQRS
jgi:hypothetical protein